MLLSNLQLLFNYTCIAYATLSICLMFLSKNEVFSHHSHFLKRILAGCVAGFSSYYLDIDKFYLSEHLYYSFEMNPLVLITFIAGWLAGLIAFIVNILLSGGITLDKVFAFIILLPLFLLKLWKNTAYRPFIITALYITLVRLLLAIPFANGTTDYRSAIIFQMASLLSLLLSFYALTAKQKHLNAFFATKKESITDRLTHVNNRASIEQELNTLSQLHTPFSIIFIDLDNFKHVNDTYGHLVGDKVLVELAELMKRSTRELDFLGRYGGEEFLIIIKNSKPEMATKIAERFRRNVENHDFVHPAPNSLHATVSIGIAYSQPDKPFEETLEEADKALYISKCEGKNRVTVS